MPPALVSCAYNSAYEDSECLSRYFTAGINFEFTEAHAVIGQQKLYDDVSERRQVVLTIQRDSCCSRYRAWILTTQCVVEQGRW